MDAAVMGGIFLSNPRAAFILNMSAAGVLAIHFNGCLLCCFCWTVSHHYKKNRREFA